MTYAVGSIDFIPVAVTDRGEPVTGDDGLMLALVPDGLTPLGTDWKAEITSETGQTGVQLTGSESPARYAIWATWTSGQEKPIVRLDGIVVIGYQADAGYVGGALMGVQYPKQEAEVEYDDPDSGVFWD